MSNARLKQLMKDNIIKPVKLPPPPKYTTPSSKEDSGCPSKSSTSLETDDIVKIVVFAYTPRTRENNIE